MTKKDYEEILQIYKDQIDSLKIQVQELREEKANLQDQNFRLQEAIVNVRAPEAYRDMVADRQPVKGLSPEEVEKNKQIRDVYNQHFQNIEDSLFKNPDDMFRLLSPALNSGPGPQARESLHSNDES